MAAPFNNTRTAATLHLRCCRIFFVDKGQRCLYHIRNMNPRSKFQVALGPNQTGEIISVRMNTGKHAGKIVQVLDIPHVTVRNAFGSVRILLPGLEGDGVVLTGKPEVN